MLCLGFVGFTFRSQFLARTMIEKLNQKVPARRKRSLFGFTFLRRQNRFWQEWHQYIPDPLARDYRISEMFAFAFLLGIAVLVFYLAGALRPAG